MSSSDSLARSRYAQLRTYRRDGTPVDTPIWFHLDGNGLVFRTKIGPKTTRVAAHPEVELRPCDYKGQVAGDVPWVSGVARVLGGSEAQRANDGLRHRYGWQYNVIPLVKVPGVTNVHSGLSLREKMRRARARDVWPDSAIVHVDLD
ncbi:MAG: PPOX class F420-dependent oxidoreductase [Mycobacteriaceae bacterium]